MPVGEGMGRGGVSGMHEVSLREASPPLQLLTATPTQSPLLSHSPPPVIPPSPISSRHHTAPAAAASYADLLLASLQGTFLLSPAPALTAAKGKGSSVGPYPSDSPHPNHCLHDAAPTGNRGFKRHPAPITSPSV